MKTILAIVLSVGLLAAVGSAQPTITQISNAGSFTPREQRAYPGGKPTTQDFSGVARVVIAVRDLEASVKRYREAYGLPEALLQDDVKFGAKLASFAGTPAVLAAPLNGQSWLATRLDKIGEGPCAFILHLQNPVQNAKSYRVTSKATWFGIEIHWLNTGKSGWWLGFE